MRVPVREIKSRLSEYLRRAERGETVSVTCHGRVVAQITPPSPDAASAMDRLALQPWVHPGRRGRPAGLDTPIALQGSGPTLTELLFADRD